MSLYVCLAGNSEVLLCLKTRNEDDMLANYKQVMLVEVEIEGEWRVIEHGELGGVLPWGWTIETLGGWYRASAGGISCEPRRRLLVACEDAWRSFGHEKCSPTVAAIEHKQTEMF